MNTIICKCFLKNANTEKEKRKIQKEKNKIISDITDNLEISSDSDE